MSDMEIYRQKRVAYCFEILQDRRLRLAVSRKTHAGGNNDVSSECEQQPSDDTPKIFLCMCVCSLSAKTPKNHGR